MARVIAPFQIKGTLDDLNFYTDENNINRVRLRGDTGITKEQFKNYPCYQKARNHGKEFGKAVKKAQLFRALTFGFNNRAKDGSFAGRANKLMLEIIKEDPINPEGDRTFENGIALPEVKQYAVGFEGNKLRPLHQVLKKAWSWDANKATLSIENFEAEKDLNWPETATHVQLAIAYTNWNYTENIFETHYSSEIIFAKDEISQNIQLTTEKPTENQWQLLSLFICFSSQERKKLKELKRANNTVSIIWSK